MILKLKRTPGIFLVGFMASGKTTIGGMLAERLGWRFVDLDKDIEERQGVSVAEIFETWGETEFRRMETDALRACVRTIGHGRPTVLALGGGTFVEPANFSLIEHNGISIWLDCPFETVRRRVPEGAHRPLARDAHRFEELYRARLADYARADYRVAIECDDPAAAVEAIFKLPPLA
jgi:shikimate kinase